MRMSSSTEEGGNKSVLVKKPDSAVELTITASAKATQTAYDKACAEVSRTITIPGFRKGSKIPPVVLENALASQGQGKNRLKAQAINDLLNSLLEPALKEEHNLEPLGQPSLVTPAELMAESFKPGQPLELTVRCDVWPDIEWKKVEGDSKPYFGIKASYERDPFDQDRFNAAKNDLRERYATTVPLEDQQKALAMGDACNVNMEGWLAVETEDGEITKGDPLPDIAAGDNVEIVMGPGRYMDGLVEGLEGAKVGDTRTVTVSFPNKLRDKTLAGKKALFDVTVLDASTRTVPEITDELAESIRPGLNKESLEEELRKAVDEQGSETWVEQRNTAMSKSLSELLEVEVPDTLVQQQVQEKYAMMMSEFREQGMADADIKKLITPENFQKYKKIEKPDVVRDFKISMAVDEIARLEGIEVPSYQVDEQMENIKKEQQQQGGDEEMDETMVRRKIETTLMRRLVFDFLAEEADLDVIYKDQAEPEIDEALLDQLAKDSLDRETASTGKDTNTVVEKEEEAVAQTEVPDDSAEEEANLVEENVITQTQVNDDDSVEEEANLVEEKEEEKKEENNSSQFDDPDMDPEERAFNILVDLGMVENTPDPDSPDYDSSKDEEMAN
uniref:peptidylprolyl isomerase n=1 Tax=Eucampia antarctica TaxID=49252 RepID=A0A7S2W9J9_9STRA